MGGVRGVGRYLSLHHVVPLFPHAADKAPDVHHVVLLHLLETVVYAEHRPRAPHTSTGGGEGGEGYECGRKFAQNA